MRCEVGEDVKLTSTDERMIKYDKIWLLGKEQGKLVDMILTYFNTCEVVEMERFEDIGIGEHANVQMKRWQHDDVTLIWANTHTWVNQQPCRMNIAARIFLGRFKKNWFRHAVVHQVSIATRGRSRTEDVPKNSRVGGGDGFNWLEKDNTANEWKTGRSTSFISG